MTSVDLMSAPAVWPLRSCISRAASAVMMEVICWSPILRMTWAKRPLILTSAMVPTS